MPQELVGTPVTRQFNRCAAKVAVVLLQLGFETAEQSEGVRRRSRESGNNLVVVESANLLRRMLDYRLPQRNLTISGQNNAAIAAHGQNCRRSDQSLRGHRRNF